jgi:hypothetical protein
MATDAERRVTPHVGAGSTLTEGLRHPFSGGWRPVVWVSLLLAGAPLVLPGVVALGYLVRVARAASRGEPAPAPGAVRGPFRDGVSVLLAVAIVAVIVGFATSVLYLAAFLPLWTLDHPIFIAIDVAAGAGLVYGEFGTIAVLAGSGELDDAVGTPLADLCLSTYFLRTVAILVALVLLTAEVALRLGGVLALGAATPYLAMAVHATLGRSYNHAVTRGILTA